MADRRTDVEGDSRFSRLELVLGAEGVERLRNACVMVLGVGGVGSNCLEALARGGIGSFILLDGDVVQASNINRQAVAYECTIGRRKVEVARDLVLAINPEAQVVTLDMMLLEDEVPSLLDQYGASVDYVVDAIDTVSTKLALAAECERRELSLISAMGAARKMRPELLEFTDIYKTKNCPLCKAVRTQARKRGIRHLEVLYSSEQPLEESVVRPSDGEVTPVRSEQPVRAPLGTLSFFPPIMGQMIAGHVIKRLVGLE